MWNPPALAGPRSQSPELGCGCSSRSPSALPPGSVHPSLSPMPGCGRQGSPFVPARAPRHPRTKPPGFPHRRGKEAPRTGEERRAESASRRRASVRCPPLACQLGAGLGLRGPPARGGHPTRGSSSAGTRPPRRRRKKAQRRGLLHTHVPCVCAPPARRRYPAGAAGISGRPHPPRPPRFAPCFRSLLGVSAAASKIGRRLCQPGCPARLRAATQRPHLPRASRTHLFLWKVGFSHCTPAVQPPPTGSWRVQYEGVPEAPAPPLNPSLSFSTAPSSAGHPPRQQGRHSSPSAFSFFTITPVPTYRHTHLNSARPRPRSLSNS